MVLGVAAGASGAYHWRLDLQQWVRRHQFRIEGLETAQPTEVQFLETNRWLDFKIPKASPLARLISNASISPDHRPVAGEQWPYAIECQLLQSQGRTTTSGVYHFKGEHLTFVDRRSGRAVEVNSYLDRRFAPLGGRNWFINLRDPGATGAAMIRLRLHSAHPDLLEVGIRVYFQTQTADRKVGYWWSRLSDDQKRDLARGNVYTFTGLTEREKACLLQYHWAVASAEGVPGRDFSRRILYVRNDMENLRVIKDWVPAGIPADADHCGVLAVTNSKGGFQVQISDYSPEAAAQTVSNTLLWHADLERQIRTNRLVWSRSNVVVLPPRSDALLQVNSSRPVYVRALHAEGGCTNDITPDPIHLLMFTCSPTNSVEYPIEHIGQEPTPFRLEVRRTPVLSGSSTGTCGVVRYELLAQDRHCLQAGETAVTNVLSPYDWLVTTNGLTNITFGQSLSFLLPPPVRVLRVRSPADTVFVNAYSRPPKLIKETRSPEDYRSSNALAPAQPSWFTLRPADYMSRREGGLTCILRVQPRLPDYDALVRAGQYEWDSFLPDFDPQGRMILLPVAEGQPLREGCLPIAYFPVTVGSSQRLFFKGEAWEQHVTPKLVLVCTNGSPWSVTVTLDRQKVFENRIETSVAEISLGEIEVGAHELNVATTRSALAYLNYLQDTNPVAYLQRFCLAAFSNTLSFPYQKRDPDTELLVARIFSLAESNPQPFEVSMTLKSPTPRGVGPFPDLTFMERRAKVTPGTPGQTYLMAANTAQLDDGQPLFFPINPDVPPGRYQLELTVNSASPRWLSLSRTTPGLAETATLLLQFRQN